MPIREEDSYTIRTLVLFFHGFKDGCSAWDNVSIDDLIYNSRDDTKKHFTIETIFPSMLLGCEQGKLSRLINTIFKKTYPESIINEWDDAVNSIDDIVDNYSTLVNKRIINGGSLVLVSHSLGTEISRLLVGKIRNDIQVTMITMGGVANVCEYEDLFSDYENVKKGINFHIDSDIALDRFLPGMYSKFFEPIGINPIDSEKCINVKMPFGAFGHSDYMDSQHHASVIKTMLYDLVCDINESYENNNTNNSLAILRSYAFKS